jgi:hypothetical protein
MFAKGENRRVKGQRLFSVLSNTKVASKVAWSLAGKATDEPWARTVATVVATVREPSPTLIRTTSLNRDCGERGRRLVPVQPYTQKTLAIGR